MAAAKEGHNHEVPKFVNARRAFPKSGSRVDVFAVTTVFKDTDP